MTVICFVEFFLVTFDTGGVINPTIWEVAGGTVEFNLIVGMGGMTRNEERFIFAIKLPRELTAYA